MSNTIWQWLHLWFSLCTRLLLLIFIYMQYYLSSNKKVMIKNVPYTWAVTLEVSHHIVRSNILELDIRAKSMWSVCIKYHTLIVPYSSQKFQLQQSSYLIHSKTLSNQYFRHAFLQYPSVRIHTRFLNVIISVSRYNDYHHYIGRCFELKLKSRWTASPNRSYCCQDFVQIATVNMHKTGGHRAAIYTFITRCPKLDYSTILSYIGILTNFIPLIKNNNSAQMHSQDIWALKLTNFSNWLKKTNSHCEFAVGLGWKPIASSIPTRVT